jgi:PAS domain S-box-containing protein
MNMNGLGQQRYKNIFQYSMLAVIIFILTYLLPFPADIYIYMILMLWIALKGELISSNIVAILIILSILIQHAIKPYETRYIFIAFAFISLIQIFINLFVSRQNTTDQKLINTQERLRSEVKLRKIFEESLLKIRFSDLDLLDTIPLAIFVYSLEGDKRFYHNRAALNLLHADDDDDDGMPRTIEDLYCFCTDGYPELVQQIRQIKDSTQVFIPPIEYRLCVGTTSVYVRNQVHRIIYDNQDALLIMMTDITESKEAEFALRESEKNHRMILESSHSAILVIPYDKSRVLYQNPAWDHLMEGENVDFLKVLDQILIPERVQEYQSISEKFRETRFIQGETQLQTLKGRRITVIFNINDIVFHGIEASLLIIHDVTEERNVQNLKVQLEHERSVRKLRDEFVTLMSHEFRTPLAIIQTSMDICLRYADHLTKDQQSHHYKNVVKQVNNMVDMVDNILLLSRANVDMLEFEPKQYNLGQYIKDLIAELSHSISPPRNIIYTVEGDFTQAIFDPTLIRHIIINLLNNALRYSEQETEIRVQLIRQGQQALINIIDHGIGIPEDAPNIFEPFIYVSNTYISNGPGLGLAIVESSTKRHGGIVTYTSSSNDTTFTVNIPIMGTNLLIDTAENHNIIHPVE